KRSELPRALFLVATFSRGYWWHHDSTVTLGELLAERGETEAAVEQFRFASWLDVNDAEALRLIAALRFRQNRFEEARAAQQRAVSRQPDEPRQYKFLAQILSAMGRDAEAQGVIAKLADLRSLATGPVAN
ncbi:MAG: tetratricopeptide repeat protein, partial [Verrucomicrobiota bacterium]|nr:tetratricopeptide repeat protein [Verrucomicrobiota bacterium]